LPTAPVEAYERGETPNSQTDSLLCGSGLAYRVRRGGRIYTALDDRHPAFSLVLSVLRALSGKRRKSSPVMSQAEPHRIEPDHPPCHFARHDFRVIQRLAEAGKGGIDLATLRRRLPDVYPDSLAGIVERLVGNGVISDVGGELTLARELPRDLRKLMFAIAGRLAKAEPKFGKVEATRRVSAHQVSDDEAPTLFGTDVRLRCLMALAKYGAMHEADLRRVVGGSQIRREGYDFAMLTRGSLVEVWASGDGGVVYGLHRGLYYLAELRGLLLAMETAHPLPPAVRQRATPPPGRRVPEWAGDRYALFGTPIRTVIMLTSGVYGWTCERLAQRCLPGYYREVVKTAIHRLEDGGLLQGNRKRQPGFELRAMTVADSFRAKTELTTLLRAVVDGWPALKSEVRAHFRSLLPKTLPHLTNKKLFSAAMLEPDPDYFGATWSVAATGHAGRRERRRPA
jgi:hypothetical protein